jgi:tRNA pseudouridine55 synthase
MNIVVNINKDYGITSQDAVAAVKRLFKVKKAGHAGTLDPTATGILLICLNEATKIAPFLSDLDKEYLMTAKLGETTDTYDSEGKVIERFEISDLRFQIKDIEKIIQRFIGEIEQIPPMYSAVKVSGKPLYKLARKGIEIERSPRRINIYSIEILNFESPFLTLRVSCSKGTYIRALCHDIGNALGVGAHVTELVRTRIGEFTIENSAKLSELPDKTEALYSIDTALKHLPEIRLEGDNFKKANHGNPIAYTPDSPIHPFTISPFIRLKDPEGRLFGIGKTSKGSIKIERLLNL